MPAHKVVVTFQTDLSSEAQANRVQSLMQLALNAIDVITDPKPTIKIEPVRVQPVSGLVVPPSSNGH